MTAPKLVFRKCTVEMLWQDLRYALRVLRKSPSFTIVAVLTLGLGIGANTATFSVMQGVVLAPLQYVNPDRLVVVWENNPRFPRTWVSYPNFRDWQRSARSFQQMAAFREQGVDFAGPGTPEHLYGKEISSGFFNTLGTELTLGREFSPEEDRCGGTPVVIISNRLWRNRFDGSPEALGHSTTTGPCYRKPIEQMQWKALRALRTAAARAQSYSHPGHRSRQSDRRIHSFVWRQSLLPLVLSGRAKHPDRPRCS